MGDEGAKNRFTDIWGKDADKSGPHSGRGDGASQMSGISWCPQSPVGANLKRLLAQRRESSQGKRGGLNVATSTVTTESEETPNLKALVESATGVPIARQRL